VDINTADVQVENGSGNYERVTVGSLGQTYDFADGSTITINSATLYFTD
jgi:hypothetical protein